MRLPEKRGCVPVALPVIFLSPHFSVRSSFLFLWSRCLLPERIANKRNQPGESVAGIGVVLDDVEGEVVGPAERPDRQSQEQTDFERRRFQKQQDAGNNADQQEKDALGPQQFGALDVSHVSLPADSA